MEFTDLALPDGRHLPIATSVVPGSGQVIQFVSAEDANKKASVKSETEAKTAQAKEQAKREWDNALKHVEAPGKIHRLERYAFSLLPVHPQYIDSGTAYFAELQQPLEFGAEPLTSELASSIGATPPEGSVVHARLVTPLSSAIARQGDDVEAVVSWHFFRHSFNHGCRPSDNFIFSQLRFCVVRSMLDCSPKMCGCRLISFSLIVRSYFFNGKLAPFFRDSTLKSDVEQDVAKLVSQFVPVARVDCFNGLVCYFDKALAKRFVRLFAVPGTLNSQAFHDFEKPFKFLRRYPLRSPFQRCFNIEKKV